MDDAEILEQIDELVAEEHELREGGLHGDEGDRLRRAEIALDRCWDLLRQRRALRAGGQRPDAAEPREPETVEGYVQ